MQPMKAPLYERLIQRQQHNPASFHVPGHQYGRTLPDEPFERYRDIMSIDVTELADTDDLHHPEGVIREAQQLAARCFGADSTFFLVGGSTAGNQAMLLAACDPGDIVIVQRNVHKSVLNGIALARAQAVFVAPRIDESTGIATTPSLADIATAFSQFPEAKALFLSTPNYYGMHTTIGPYAELAHAHDALLLVDEAHGAHYGLHDAFPQPAIRSGADAAVQSTHKTLTALTMGAMMHVREGRLSMQRLRHALTVVQSSSPSYPILASIDIARAMVDAYGPAWFNRGIQAADRLRQRLADRKGPLDIVKKHPNALYNELDPMRIVLYDRTCRLSGFRLQQQLAEEGSWAEMADDRHVVLLFGPGASYDAVDRLTAAIDRIEHHIQDHLSAGVRQPNIPPPEKIISDPVTLPLMPHHAEDTQRVPLQLCEGRIAAETVIPYPPGIPLLYPGEIIHARQLADLRRLADLGAKFQGAEDGRMETIRVMRER